MRQDQIHPSSVPEARCSLFSVLALGFSPPRERGLKELSGWIAEVLRQATSVSFLPAPEERIRSLEIALTVQAKAAEITSLVAEYHRLFVGPYNLLVAPYESIYRETDRTVMGESTLDVMKRYEEAGFSLSSSFKDLPDHIAAELEFMALLCEEEGAAWQRNDFSLALKLLSHEETFLGEHLVRWVPDFTLKIISTTESPFYRALASLLQDYVLFDLDCVRSLRRLLEAKETTPLMKEGAIDGA
jgi:TorA maturation chaperone TorD